MCFLLLLSLTSFMWGKQGMYHYLLFYRKYLGSKWIAQACITTSWLTLNQNSGLPAPSTFPSTGQTWNGGVSFQRAVNTGNLIPLSPLSRWSYLGRRTRRTPFLSQSQHRPTWCHSRINELSVSDSDISWMPGLEDTDTGWGPICQRAESLWWQLSKKWGWPT